MDVEVINNENGDGFEPRKHKKKQERKDELHSTINSETDFAEQLSPKRKKKNHKRQDDSVDNVVEVQINAKEKTEGTNHEIKSNKKKERKKMYSDGISQLDSTVNSETDFMEQLSPKKKKHKKGYDEPEIVFIGEQINNIQEIIFDQNENVDLENNVSSKNKLKKSISGSIESNAVDISNWDENNLIELFPSKKKKHKKRSEGISDKMLQASDEQINIEHTNSKTNEIQINSSFENNSDNPTIIFEENNLTEQSTPKRKKKCSKIVESDDDEMYKNNEPKYLILSRKIEHLRRRKKLLGEKDASDEDEVENVMNLIIDINWDIPPIHQVTQLVSTKKIEMERNQCLKKGAWSINEELTMVNNWKKFEEEYKIHNPMSLLGLKKQRNKGIEGKKKQRNKELEELQLDFVRYLGRDLNNRTLISIYQQARRMFDPHNYKGRMSEIEYKIVKRLVMKYGHKWEKIGRKMNRTGESVRYAWEKLESQDKNYGKWAQEEDDALIEALKHVSGCENLKNLGHHNLPWKKVSEIVKTRDRWQCRLRWLAQLSIEYNEVKPKEWTTDHKIKLLELLDESDYMCESYIPWEEFAADFGLVNCIKMRAKWSAIKSKAPNYYVKTFRENLDWLVTNYLPVLRRSKTTW